MVARSLFEVGHPLVARVAAVAVMAAGMSVAWQEIEFHRWLVWQAELIQRREDAVRVDLYTMRSCIDQHFADKGYYPESLQVLVDEGYLRAIPPDPFSGTAEGAWEELYAEPDELDACREERGNGNQVVDVRYANSVVVAFDGIQNHSW